MKKAPEAFRTISEVSELLETPAHVLRFWESKFYQIRPVKRAGGRRYYRPDDVALINGIRILLQDHGLTIRGAQRVLQEKGPRHVIGLGSDLPAVAELIGDGPLPGAETAADAEPFDESPHGAVRHEGGGPKGIGADGVIPGSRIPAPDPADGAATERAARPAARTGVPPVAPPLTSAPPLPPGADTAHPLPPGATGAPPLSRPVLAAVAPPPDLAALPPDLPPDPPGDWDADRPGDLPLPPRIPELLRRMPRDGLARQHDRVFAISRRMDALLDRMSEASGAGRW